MAGTCLIAALALGVYAPIFPGSFVMDDHRLVNEGNPLVTGELTMRSVWFQTDFPLTLSTWWVERFLWGDHPAGYHAVNVTLLVASALLLWRVLAELRVPGAWLAGAMFAVHPVVTGTVARIAELKNTLSLPFFLLSFWAYLRYESACLYRTEKTAAPGPGIRPRVSWWFVLSFVAFVLALLGKTTTVMLPVVLLGCAAWQRGRINARDVRHTMPYFLVALPFGLMSVWFQKFQALAGETVPAQSLWERLSIAGRDFWFYAGKAWLPVNQTVFYPRWNTDISSPEAVLPVLLAAAVFIFFGMHRRTWGRHALFGTGCFAVLLSPALGFVDAQCFTKFQVSDHLQYLPLAAMVSLAAAGIASWPNRRVSRAVAGALVLGLTILAFRRAEAFASEKSLMRDALAKNRTSWAPYNDLGVALIKEGKQAEAMDCFRAEVELSPETPQGHLNLGLFFTRQGRLAEARAQFRTAVAIQPSLAQAHEDLAMVLGRMGRNRDAILELHKALQCASKVEVRLELAGLLYQSREFRRVVVQYRRVLAVDADNLNALNNLAWLLATCSDEGARNGAEAIRLAQRSCRLTGFKQSSFVSTLAAAYAEAGRFPEAVETAETALKMQTAAGETQFAAINRELLQFYRAGKSWHQD